MVLSSEHHLGITPYQNPYEHLSRIDNAIDPILYSLVILLTAIFFMTMLILAEVRLPSCGQTYRILFQE